MLISPYFKGKNISDSRFADTKFSCQLAFGNATLHESLSYLLNSVFGQFMHRMIFAGWINTLAITSSALATLLASTSAPSLTNHILDVIFLSTKKQVFWIDAFWIVTIGAIVQYIQPIRNYAMSEFPRNAMCRNILSANPEIPISSPSTRPYPAAIITGGFIDLFPKSCNSLFWGILVRSHRESLSFMAVRDSGVSAPLFSLIIAQKE